MKRPRALIIFISCLLLTGLFALVYKDSYLGNDHSKIRSLQRYLGGIGLGSVVSPEWGFLNYDPRIDHVDETGLWPIPGGYSYSPERGFSLSDIKEITLQALLPNKAGIFRVAEATEKEEETFPIEHPIKNPPLYTDHRRCDNCLMDRNKWARTRYDFETSKGKFYTCSIHCVAVLSLKLKEEPKNVRVAEYMRPETMLEASRAFFVIGSIAPGTMSKISKIAFSSKEEAESFVKRYGGRVVDFNTALSEALKEIKQR